uniref:Uncharacterized protein n=1 Tax=Arundo donax TaxID=35708 RepID=A0A0A9FCQ9_ARUDO
MKTGKKNSTAPLCIKFIILALFSNQAQKKPFPQLPFTLSWGWRS